MIAILKIIRHFFFGRQSCYIFLPTLILLFFHLPIYASQIIVSPGDSSIQASINAANPHDVLVLKGGEYKENIFINKSITLRADESGQPVILIADVEDENVITISDVNNVLIKDLLIKGSKSSGIKIVKSSNVRIVNNRLVNNKSGIFVEETTDSEILGNVIEENDTGIFLRDSVSITIRKNRVDSNHDKGILLYKSNSNNIVENSANSNLWNGITLVYSNRNLISKNEVINNTYPIVVSESSDNLFNENRTMRRLKFILPVVLIYLSIMLYMLEKKMFIYYINHRREDWVE